MIHYGWAIATFIVGGVIGIFIAALCNMAAQDNKNDDDEWRVNKW